jgi:hypothetical protein
MSENPPKKGEIIINPNTQRPVRVGSRTWLKLVKEGVVEGRYTDPKELGELPEKYEELPPEEVKQQIEEINRTLPRGKQAVRGRGRYKGKIVSRNIRLGPEEVSKYTAKVATRAVANNIEQLANSEDDDIEGMLEKLILEEMMSGKPDSEPPKRGRGRPKKQPQAEEKYEVEDVDEYDYEEVEEQALENNYMDEDYDEYEY